MTDRLPHVREPSSGEPDVCVHCREEWVDLLTLYETDECSVRLRAEVERLQSYAADCEQHAKFAAEKATALERAAVVAWLREAAYLELYEETPQVLADMIERGEHRREEAK